LTDTETQERRNAVLELSVWNMLRHTGASMSACQLVTRLRQTWRPAWDNSTRAITVTTVRAASQRLAARGWVTAGEMIAPTQQMRGPSGLAQAACTPDRRDLRIVSP